MEKRGEGGGKEKQKSGCPCGHSQLYAGSLFVFLFFICVFLVVVCVFASFSKHGVIMFFLKDLRSSMRDVRGSLIK